MVARPVNVFGSMHERVGLPHATIYWASKFHCVTHNREIAMHAGEKTGQTFNCTTNW